MQAKPMHSAKNFKQASQRPKWPATSQSQLPLCREDRKEQKLKRDRQEKAAVCHSVHSEKRQSMHIESVCHTFVHSHLRVGDDGRKAELAAAALEPAILVSPTVFAPAEAW